MLKLNLSLKVIFKCFCSKQTSVVEGKALIKKKKLIISCFLDNIKKTPMENKSKNLKI